MKKAPTDPLVLSTISFLGSANGTDKGNSADIAFADTAGVNGVPTAKQNSSSDLYLNKLINFKLSLL